MKFKKTLIASIVVLAFAAIALAAGLTNRDDQAIYGNWHIFNTWKFWSGSTMNVDGTLDLTDATITATGKITATHVADIVRFIDLPIGSFITSGAMPLSTTTGPGLEIDDSIPAMVWADGETTPAIITFRVPTDYSSGGSFRVFATESNSTTPNQIDFDVYVNADSLAADASATDQTPAALAGTTSTGDVVTLTVATDFASLAADQWVSLRIWRDNTADGTGDLEVKGVGFYYTATQ